MPTSSTYAIAEVAMRCHSSSCVNDWKIIICTLLHYKPKKKNTYFFKDLTNF